MVYNDNKQLRESAYRIRKNIFFPQLLKILMKRLNNCLKLKLTLKLMNWITIVFPQSKKANYFFFLYKSCTRARNCLHFPDRSFANSSQTFLGWITAKSILWYLSSHYRDYSNTRNRLTWKSRVRSFLKIPS